MGRLAAFVFLSVLCLVSLACSSGTSAGSAPSPAASAGTGGAGGSGAGGSDAGGSDASGGVGGVVYGAGGFSPTGGSGGAGETCSGYFVRADGSQTECDRCGASQCCAEASACEADAACSACTALPVGHGCDLLKDPAPTWQALSACLAAAGVGVDTGPCAAACASVPRCNVVTAAGCADGSACDVDTSSNQRCFQAGAAALCEPCDTTKASYCGPSLHCLSSGQCARFCCDDGDCGSGRCVSWPLGGGRVGVCIAGSSGEIAACDAPPDAPSGGSCVDLHGQNSTATPRTQDDEPMCSCGPDSMNES